ncbi:hypothetical protein P3L10_003797 [Capsicum annuum]
MVVVIWECAGGKEIDLHAAHLHMLECKINNNVRFFSSFVPVLENVMVWRDFQHSYSYVFGDCARDLPGRVKSLTLQFTPDQIYPSFENPTEMQMFRNLRNLSLKLVTSLAIVEIFELSRLLGDFPLLQSLTFVVIKLPVTREIRRRRSPSPTRHTELKQVTYGGFNGLDTEMEFVLYILRCAVALEQMFLSPGYKNDFSLEQKSVLNLSFDEEKRNLIQQQLHGQAISGKATVIIQ